MKVLVLFPPQWVPYQPHLGLPSVVAFLRSNGVDVVQKDLNIDSLDDFLSRKYLRSLKPRLEGRFAELDSRQSLTPGFEQRLYAELFLSKSSVRYLAENVDDAKNVFRSPDYYDASILATARKTIDSALAVVSSAHHPTRLGLMSLLMPSYDGTFESVEILSTDRTQNPYIEYYERDTLPFIRSQSPTLVGISVAGESQLIPALTLSRLIKKHLPAVHIVMGGYLVTLLASVFKKNPLFFQEFFDSLIVLEGERPMLELARCLEQNKPLVSVPNLVYLNGETVVENPTIPPEPMALLPPPDFDGLPLKKYLAPELVLPVLASRGCYWGKCAFCSHNLSYENKYRAATATKIAANLQELAQRYGVNKFAFSDEAIAPSIMRDLTTTLVEGDFDFRFSTNIRFEPQFDANLCEKMHSAGFRVVYLGLESGCNRILDVMRKGTDSNQALITCRNLIQARIWNHLYVFLGFPGETHAEAEETVRFLQTNSAIIRSFNIGSFTLGRGSAVMSAPESFGVTLLAGGKPDNLSVTLEYTPAQGLTRQMAAEMSKNAWADLSEIYPARDVLRLLSKEDLLLHLSHFESTDPQLSSIKSSGSSLPPPNGEDQPITIESKPSLQSGVILSAIGFNLMEILQLAPDQQPANRQAQHVVFNPASKRMRQIDPHALEVIKLFNGERTIKQIARSIGKKFGVPEPELENYCRDLLNRLSKDSFIRLL